MPNLRIKLVVGETERWINHIYYEYFRPVLTDRDREIDGQTLASSTTFGEPKKEESWEERFEAGFLELDLKDTQPSVFNYDTCVRPKEEQGATLYTIIVDGLFDIEMDSSENDEFFLEWIAKGRMEHGYFQIFRPHEDQIIWLEFWDGFCVSYQEHMSKGNRPPVMKLRISPAITRNRKTVVQQENWKISDIDMKWKLATVQPVEDEGEFTAAYLENKEGKRIEEYEIGDTVFLIVQSEGKQGKTFTANLNDQDADFEYKGKRLENDRLEYSIQNNTERIELKVIAEKE